MPGQEVKYLPYLACSASSTSFIIHGPGRVYQNVTMVNIPEKASDLLALGTHGQVTHQDQ